MSTHHTARTPRAWGIGVWILALVVLAWGALWVAAMGVALLPFDTVEAWSVRLQHQAHGQWQRHREQALVARGWETMRAAMPLGQPDVPQKTQFFTRATHWHQALQSKTGLQFAWVDDGRVLFECAHALAQVVGWRSLRLLCAWPVWLGLMSVAWVDGSVIRARRRFQGARESAFVFHQLKRAWWAVGSLGVWGYLAAPWPVTDVGWIPTLVVLTWGLAITCGRFKKYW